MTRTIGPQILPIRDFLNPDSTPRYGERTENSTQVRERYPDVEKVIPPDSITRTPVFAADDYFFVVRRVEVIKGVYATSVPALVRGDQIAAAGQEIINSAKISDLEFLAVYYASVLVN